MSHNQQEWSKYIDAINSLLTEFKRVAEQEKPLSETDQEQVKSFTRSFDNQRKLMLNEGILQPIHDIKYPHKRITDNGGHLDKFYEYYEAIKNSGVTWRLANFSKVEQKQEISSLIGKLEDLKAAVLDQAPEVRVDLVEAAFQKVAGGVNGAWFEENFKRRMKEELRGVIANDKLDLSVTALAHTRRIGPWYAFSGQSKRQSERSSLIKGM